MSSSTPELIYDDFLGDEVDFTRWAFLDIPLPDGTSYRAADPAMRMTTQQGSLMVRIDQFSTSHDSVQMLDNAKLMLLSTREFRLPEHGVATFSVRQAVRQVGLTPVDHLLGMAVLNIMDLASGLVFDIAASGRHLFAVHEKFGADPTSGTEFTRMIEDPFRVATRPDQAATLQITFDTRDSAVKWSIDEHVIYHIHDAELPESVRMGLGILTAVKLTEQGSGSLQGQGVYATWTCPTITVTEEVSEAQTTAAARHQFLRR